MCLAFFAVGIHPTYKLVVATNRDEFYQRKTEDAHFWADHPTLVGGRDLEGGGTWMGMTRSGRISLLTNYRDPLHIDPQAPTRGALVSDYLIGTESPDAYLQHIAQHGKQYNGFNLVMGYPDQLWYYSNYKEGVDKLPPGFYGLSNHLLETPWPKVVRGKEKIKPLLLQQTLQPDELFTALYDEHRAPKDALPDTGLTIDREEALSSMFIKTGSYGTRCSTVVLVDHDNHVRYTERVYDLSTFAYRQNDFTFTIESPIA